MSLLILGTNWQKRSYLYLVKDFSNDNLGFQQFAIDEQLMSILSQLSGSYVRLAIKAEKSDYLKEYSQSYIKRFNEIDALKFEIKYLSYPEKAETIQKISEELKSALEKEKTAA